MNYPEFKQSLLKAWDIMDTMLTMEEMEEGAIFCHKHILFIDEEYGLQCPGLKLYLGWDAIENLLEKGEWENYQEDDSTIMVVRDVKYRIKLHKLTSLETLI